jgi:hypothetical protein
MPVTMVMEDFPVSYEEEDTCMAHILTRQCPSTLTLQKSVEYF